MIRAILLSAIIGLGLTVIEPVEAKVQQSVSVVRQLPLKSPKRLHKNLFWSKVLIQNYQIYDDNDDTTYVSSNEIIARAKKPQALPQSILDRLMIARLMALKKHQEIWG